MASTVATAAPEDQVQALIQQTADEYNLEVFILASEALHSIELYIVGRCNDWSSDAEENSSIHQVLGRR